MSTKQNLLFMKTLFPIFVTFNDEMITYVGPAMRPNYFEVSVNIGIATTKRNYVASTYDALIKIKLRLYKPFTDSVTDSLTFLSPFSELVAKHEYFFSPSSDLTARICKSPVPEVTAYLPAVMEI